MIVAIDVLKWPGMNVQFIVSFLGAVLLTLVAIPYGKRRPVGSPLTWGQAMLAATYVFAVFFLAYGIVPHQWLTHEQNQLNWRADRIWIGHNSAAEVLSTSVCPSTSPSRPSATSSSSASTASSSACRSSSSRGGRSGAGPRRRPSCPRPRTVDRS